MTNVYEKSELVEQYEEYRPEYPTEVVTEILKFLDEQNPGEKRRGFMLDVGCGGGQATRLFAPHFDKTLGIDPSVSQISMAKKTVPNAEFKIGLANEFPVESGSVDLIISGMAAHYFDMDEFVSECDRALRPGGCVALFMYTVGKIKTAEGKDFGQSAESEIQSVIMKYIGDIGISAYIVKAIDQRYQPIYDLVDKPRKRFERGIQQEKQLTLNEYVSCLETIGEYRLNKSSYGDEDPLVTVKSGLEKFVENRGGNGSKKPSFTMTFEFPIVLFRK